MPVYQWYATHETDGTTDQVSVLVDVWFDTVAPADPSLYDVIIIDSDGDGAISPAEWTATTGSAGTKARGSNDPAGVELYDPDPSGVNDGVIYTSSPIPIGTPNVLDGLVSDFAPIPPEDLDPTIVCFVKGTMIETAKGLRAVEDLKEGDLVRTVDAGFAPLRAIWTGRYVGYGLHAPVRIEAGVLGNFAPLCVSQNHRILVTGAGLALGFGLDEALVMAKSLTSIDGIEIEERAYVRYHHLMFDAHELVYADGIAAESYFTGNVLSGAARLREGSAELFGDAMDEYPVARTCRPCLTHREGQVLAGNDAWTGVAADREVVLDPA